LVKMRSTTVPVVTSRRTSQHDHELASTASSWRRTRTDASCGARSDARLRARSWATRSDPSLDQTMLSEVHLWWSIVQRGVRPVVHPPVAPTGAVLLRVAPRVTIKEFAAGVDDAVHTWPPHPLVNTTRLGPRDTASVACLGRGGHEQTPAQERQRCEDRAQRLHCSPHILSGFCPIA